MVKTDPLSVTLDSTSVTSMTLSWALPEELTATSYTISYSNTNNTQCFTDSNDITDIAASETTYTLTDLQEDTEYSITVTALLSDGETERDTLVAATMASGKCFNHYVGKAYGHDELKKSSNTQNFMILCVVYSSIYLPCVYAQFFICSRLTILFLYSSSICSTKDGRSYKGDLFQHHSPVGGSGLHPPQWGYNRLLSAIWSSGE